MKTTIMVMMSFALVFSAFAADFTISKERSSLKFKISNIEVDHQRSNGFSEIKISGLTNSGQAKGPSLPKKAIILEGKPSEIKINTDILGTQVLRSTTPEPMQVTQCRCEPYRKSFEIDEKLYSRESSLVELKYLGDFRGTHLTKVVFNLAQYNHSSRSVEVITELAVRHNSREFEPKREEDGKYLILGTQELLDGAAEFITWKRSQGFEVYTEVLTPNLISLENVRSSIKDYYDNKKINFSIILGTETIVPTDYKETDFSYRTPTDLFNYTFGDDENTDYIPEVYFSRIIAETADEVRNQLSKSIRHEVDSMWDLAKFERVVGVASNEGSSPSDNEYVQSIGDTFTDKLDVEYTHFYENDSVSNPQDFNSALNRGVSWYTYMGHGSGTSWPSFNRTYSTTHIRQLDNAEVAKPIIIDVACQNGKLNATNYIGSLMMNITDEQGRPTGAAAYYGGSVNISWHPPAIMAQGIAEKLFSKEPSYLGEALLLGQLHLAENWTDISAVRDNMIWYHLQGDPGLDVRVLTK